MVAFPFKKTLPCSLMARASSSEFFHFFGGKFLHVFILRIKKSKETIQARQNKGRLKTQTKFSDDLCYLVQRIACPSTLKRFQKKDNCRELTLVDVQFCMSANLKLPLPEEADYRIRCLPFLSSLTNLTSNIKTEFGPILLPSFSSP